MFEQQTLISLYAVSPVHVGSGSSLGLIDNPIQREKHSSHPCIAGSGLKGAVRHSFEKAELIEVLFGPEVDRNKDAFMGAVSFGDAQLLVFPIRSLKNSFVYATCPLAIHRALRLLSLSGMEQKWSVKDLDQGQVMVNNDSLLQGGHLQLEAFEYKAVQTKINWAESFSQLFLSDHPSMRFFKQKLARDLVILSDTDFNYFVNYSTSVEPHVRIDANTGTAQDGGLFYTENLPPESILIAPILFSRSRQKYEEKILEADEVAESIKQFLHQRLLQVGGDATSGRGLLFSQCII